MSLERPVRAEHSLGTVARVRTEGEAPAQVRLPDVEGRPWLRTSVLREPRVRSVHDALREIAAAVPDRVAIDDGERQLTYMQLLQATNSVARVVEAHDRSGKPQVSVVVDRGIDGIVSVLGVMTAGRVAVPLDAQDPVERLAVVHREAQASLVVSCSSTGLAAKTIAGETPLVVLDDVARAADSSTDRPCDRTIDPASLAIVLFTSGSTGTPKGVMRDHDGLVRRSLVMAYSNRITTDDRVAVTGSFGFSGAYIRSLGAFFSAATACVDLRSVGLRDFAAWVTAQQITVLPLVPSVLRSLVAAAPDARMSSVRLVTLIGETLYAHDVQRARPLFGPRVVFENRLGATESAPATVWAVASDDELDDGPVPVGHVEPWVEIRIVDDDGEDVPVGEPGRLEVVSDHQALGYWRDPRLTAACFFRLPDGRRGFRTSDIVRMRHDGMLEHLGRADDRVKVRGAMVSPSEVELALTRLDGVGRAAVVPIPARDGGTRLAAYVVPDRDATLSAWQIRRDLAAQLPTTMIPAVVVMLETLPLSSRGKVDRASLPPPPPPTARPYHEPIGHERELAELFGEVLGLDDVGLDDDFFELGGDSLAVLELLAGIDERFGVELSATAVLAAPTVADLATRLVRRRHTAGTVVLLRAAPDTTAPPVFCVAGGGSPAVSLRPLADALGDHRSCYGVQARGLEETARPDRSVEAAARRHLGEIRAVQPTGPYLLAGYSFGGLVGFEMACRLEAAGERVALLVILDTPAPATTATRRERLVASAPAPHEGLTRRARWAARAARLHARERVAIASAGIVPRRSLHQYHLFLRLARRMGRAYTPSSTYAGPLLVTPRRTVDVRGRPRLVRVRARPHQHDRSTGYPREHRSAPLRHHARRRAHSARSTTRADDQPGFRPNGMPPRFDRAKGPRSWDFRPVRSGSKRCIVDSTGWPSERGSIR